MRWAEILRVACTTEDPTRWISTRESTARDAGEPTDEDCYYALRLVCRELGGESFPPDRYTLTRRRLIARDRRRRGGGLLAELLPTAHQIAWHYGGEWNRALAGAGLPRYEQRVTDRRATVGTVRPERALEIVEAIVYFARANDRLPGKATLREFCRAWKTAIVEPEPRQGPRRLPA